MRLRGVWSNPWEFDSPHRHHLNAEIFYKIVWKICGNVERDYFVDGDNELKVTMSIGAAIITSEDTEASLFERADKALYQAKQNGRNQIVLDI